MKLEDVPTRCFHGVVPSMIATVAPDGVPNTSYLSSLERLPSGQVALTCQFFNKTKQNVLANPHACLQVYDPVTFEAYRIEVRYHHEECEGPLFERTAIRLDAIAWHAGMKGIFRLRSVDVYDVLSVERRDGYLDGTEITAPPRAPDPRPRSEIRALQIVSGLIREAPDFDSLLRTLFAALDEELGFAHGMVLVPEERGERLVVVGTYGYPEDAVGGEVPIGVGLIGSVARDRAVLRMTGVDSELRYQRAIRTGVERTTARRELVPEIPLPGLPDAETHLAIPLLVGERLLGVLAVESRDRNAFEEWHEAFLEIVANQVAVTMDNVLLREREDADAPEAPIAPATAPLAAPTSVARVTSKAFRFFPRDDCLFVDDDYLIRSVPARILWHVLTTHAKTGRVDFTNRELRVAPAIGLPEYRDNLESRLVLLRRRLAQKCPEVRLASTGRGRFRLETDAALVLDGVD